MNSGVACQTWHTYSTTAAAAAAAATTTILAEKPLEIAGVNILLT